MSKDLFLYLVIGVLVILLLAFMLAFLRILTRVKKLKQEMGDLAKGKQELEAQVQPLQLESINYKLNPHLFKNVLNSIQSHSYQTYYTLDKLANVLDYVLYESDNRLVSLKEEMDFVLNFIEINRIKVSPLFDLRLRNNINGEDKWYTERVIAPLITVDLIENAFKHSDLQSADSFISIVFEIETDHLILTVVNKVSHAPILRKEKSGLGSVNLRKRLNIIYPSLYQLNQSSADGIYTAQLKLDLNACKAKMYSS